MASIDELHQALIKADAAGDTEGAKALADHIRLVQAASENQPSAMQPQNPAPQPSKTKGLADFANFVTQQPMDAADAFGHHVGNFLHGSAQLIQNGLTSGVEAVAPNSSIAKRMRQVTNNDQAILNAREKEYQANVPNSAGAYAGATLGEIAPFLVGGGLTSALSKTGDYVSKLPQFIGSKFGQTGASIGNGVGRVASGATQGGLAAATAPVITSGPSITNLVTGNQPENYWDAKKRQMLFGSAVGGGIPIVGAAANGTINLSKGIYNALQPIVDPKSIAANAVLKNIKNPQAVLDAINQAPSYVPGSMPTTAQVVGDPSLVMAEKIMRNNPKYMGRYQERAAANNTARNQVISDVAKTSADLDAATQNRADIATPLYDQAKAENLPIDPELAKIISRPSAQKAIARGKALAAEKDESINLPSQSNDAINLVDQNGNPFPATGQNQGAVSGNILHYLKMGLDDLSSLKKDPSNGIGVHEADAINNTKKDFLNWYDNASGTYQAARKAFAENSVPVNTMELGQQLQKDFADNVKNSSGDVSLPFANYKSRLARALNDTDYPINSDAQAALEGVKKDLQRETISNSIRFPGSDTAFNMDAPNWLSKQLYGNDYGGDSILPKALAGATFYLTGSPTSAAGAYLGTQKIGQFAGNNVTGALNQLLLNPQDMSKALQAALEKANSPGLLQSLIGDPALAPLIQTSPQAAGYISGK